MSGETHFGLNLKIEIEWYRVSSVRVRRSRSREINKLAGFIFLKVGGVADEVTNE